MRNAWGLRGCLVILALIALASPVVAQPNVLEFGPGIRVSVTMQLLAVPNPVSVAAIRLMAATDVNAAPLLIPEWTLDFDAPIPLPADLLELQRDGTPIPPKNKPLSKLDKTEMAYWAIQDAALIDTRLISPELFKKAGEANAHATYDHLFNDPGEWRGKVVTVRGRLLRVRKWRPSQRAQDNGIEFVYEGFIAGETPHRPPYWILFTTLPEGLPVRETMSVPVTFYGYFIKKIKYPAEKVDRVTNLLIGPTVYVEPGAVETPPSTPFSQGVLFAVMGGALGVLAILIAMQLWFRRGDHRVHKHLAAMRDRQPLVLGDEESAASDERANPPSAG